MAKSWRFDANCREVNAVIVPSLGQASHLIFLPNSFNTVTNEHSCKILYVIVYLKCIQCIFCDFVFSWSAEFPVVGIKDVGACRNITVRSDCHTICGVWKKVHAYWGCKLDVKNSGYLPWRWDNVCWGSFQQYFNRIELVLWKLSHVMRKPVYAICKQQRHRSACAFAQSDQHLCFSLPRQYNFFMWNFMTLASLCSWADRF